MTVRTPGLVAASLLAAGTALAEGHYTPAPLLGERAASLAGAFTAVADEPTAAWYNPAGLVALPGSVLGGSLDLYELSFYRRADAVRLGDEGQPLEARQLATVPSAFGVAWLLGEDRDQAVAMSLLVPESETLSAAVAAEGTDASVVREVEITDQTWLAGPSYALRLAPGLSVGASLFYELRRRRESDRLRTAAGGAPEAPAALRLESADYDAARGALVAVAGARWATGPWALGLTLYPPTPTLHDALHIYRSSGASPGPEAPAGLYLRQTFDTGWEVRTPWRLHAGVAWRGGAWLVSADVRGQTGGDAFATYAPPEESGLPARTIRPRPIVNGALGAELVLNEDLAVRAGAYTRFAGLEHPDGDDPAAPEVVDQMGAAFGFTKRDGATTMTVGLGYTYASGASPGLRQVVGDDGRARLVGEADAVRRHALRFSLGGSYAF